jgi:hypothetical protein
MHPDDIQMRRSGSMFFQNENATIRGIQTEKCGEKTGNPDKAASPRCRVTMKGHVSSMGKYQILDSIRVKSIDRCNAAVTGTKAPNVNNGTCGKTSMLANTVIGLPGTTKSGKKAAGDPS